MPRARGCPAPSPQRHHCRSLLPWMSPLWLTDKQLPPNPLSQLGQGFTGPFPQPGLQKTFPGRASQARSFPGKTQPNSQLTQDPTCPDIPIPQLDTQVSFSSFTHNCLSQSLSLGLIQPFGLGLFLIARTISIWARNTPPLQSTHSVPISDPRKH